MSVPITEVRNYLGVTHSFDESEIAEALAAETVAQANACRIPDPYPADLALALKRRVARALEMKNMPLGSKGAVDETGLLGAFRPGADPEVRRYEAPYRKVVMA